MTDPIRINTGDLHTADVDSYVEMQSYLRRDVGPVERPTLADSRDLRQLVLSGGVLDGRRACGLGRCWNHGLTTATAARRRNRFGGDPDVPSCCRGASVSSWARPKESFAAILPAPSNAGRLVWVLGLSADWSRSFRPASCLR